MPGTTSEAKDVIVHKVDRKDKADICLIGVHILVGEGLQ